MAFWCCISPPPVAFLFCIPQLCASCTLPLGVSACFLPALLGAALLHPQGRMLFSPVSAEGHPGPGKGGRWKGFQQRCLCDKKKILRSRGSQKGGCHQSLQHLPRLCREPIDILQTQSYLTPGWEQCFMGKALKCMLKIIYCRALFKHLLSAKHVHSPLFHG